MSARIAALAVALLAAGCPCHPTGADPCGGRAGTSGHARFAVGATPYDVESCLDARCASSTVVSPVAGVLTLSNGVELVLARPDASTGTDVALLLPFAREPDRRFVWTLAVTAGGRSTTVARDVDTGAVAVPCDATCAVDQVVDFGALAP